MKILEKLDFLLIINMYLKDNMSAIEVGKICDCSNTTIYNILKDFNIKRRSLSEAGYISNNKPEFIKKIRRCGKEANFYGRKHSIESKNKIRLSKLGNKNPMFGKRGKLSPVWRNGISYIEYPQEFNNEVKEKIKRRDNYQCKNCNITERKYFSIYNKKLEIHHIDYNKKNNNINNLITLCKQCNIEANNNRDYWKIYYKTIINNQILLF